MSKGQSQVTPEAVINLMSFIIMTVVALGTMLNVMLYRVTYESRFEDRQLIDSIENFIGSKCLVYEKDGEYLRGVLYEENLTAGQHCLILSENTYFKVEGDGKVWEFGNFIPDDVAKSSFTFPVVIARNVDGNTEFIPAKVEGRI
ncbi:MAG: hypothetical protein NTW30_01565 [Candidatus Aenigmarchaeota archaeon]|nr:hypothetical protein [Candidatus Aenigmarchaeota archaeon]